MHTLSEIKTLYKNVKESFDNATEILKQDSLYVAGDSVGIKVLKKQVTSYKEAFKGLEKVLTYTGKLSKEKEIEVGMFFDNLKRAPMALLTQHDRIKNAI